MGVSFFFLTFDQNFDRSPWGENRRVFGENLGDRAVGCMMIQLPMKLVSKWTFDAKPVQATLWYVGSNFQILSFDDTAETPNGVRGVRSSSVSNAALNFHQCAVNGWKCFYFRDRITGVWRLLSEVVGKNRDKSPMFRQGLTFIDKTLENPGTFKDPRYNFRTIQPVEGPGAKNSRVHLLGYEQLKFIWPGPVAELDPFVSLLLQQKKMSFMKTVAFDDTIPLVKSLREEQQKSTRSSANSKVTTPISISPAIPQVISGSQTLVHQALVPKTSAPLVPPPRL